MPNTVPRALAPTATIAICSAPQPPAAAEQLFVPDTPTSSADGGAPSLPTDAGLHRRALKAAAAAAAAGGAEADSQGRGRGAAAAGTPRAAALAAQAVPDTVGAPASSGGGPPGRLRREQILPQPSVRLAGRADAGAALAGGGGERPGRKRCADSPHGGRREMAQRWRELLREVSPPGAAAGEGAAAPAAPPAASPLPMCELSYPQLSGPAGVALGALAHSKPAGTGAVAASAPSRCPQGGSAPVVAGHREPDDVHGDPGHAALSSMGLPCARGLLGACFSAPGLPVANSPLRAGAALVEPGVQPAAAGRSPGRQSSLGKVPFPDHSAGLRPMLRTREAALLPSRPGGASSAPQQPSAGPADQATDAAMGASAGAVPAVPGGGFGVGAAGSRGSMQAGSPGRAAKRQRLDGGESPAPGAACAGGGGLAAGGPAAAWRGDAVALGEPTLAGRGGAAVAGSPAPARTGSAAAAGGPIVAGLGCAAAARSPAAAERCHVAAAGSRAAVGGDAAAAQGSPAAANSGGTAAADSWVAAATNDQGATISSSDSESEVEAVGLRIRALPGVPRGAVRVTRRCAHPRTGKAAASGGPVLARSMQE